jgi:hypothetical protein
MLDAPERVLRRDVWSAWTVFHERYPDVDSKWIDIWPAVSISPLRLMVGRSDDFSLGEYSGFAHGMKEHSIMRPHLGSHPWRRWTCRQLEVVEPTFSCPVIIDGVPRLGGPKWLQPVLRHIVRRLF